MNITITKCTRCGDCCKESPCLFSQLAYGYPVLLGLTCPELETLPDGTTSCKLVQRDATAFNTMIGTGCEKPLTENPLTFKKVIVECLTNKELVEQFNRLRGTKLGIDSRAPIVRMIDEATGFKRDTMDERYKHDELRLFFEFVFDAIWLPMMIEEHNKQTSHK
jgi:hypothetical protein